MTSASDMYFLVRKIARLENQIEELKQQNGELEKRIEKLEVLQEKAARMEADRRPRREPRRRV